MFKKISMKIARNLASLIYCYSPFPFFKSFMFRFALGINKKHKDEMSKTLDYFIPDGFGSQKLTSDEIAFLISVGKELNKCSAKDN